MRRTYTGCRKKSVTFSIGYCFYTISVRLKKCISLKNADSKV